MSESERRQASSENRQPLQYCQTANLGSETQVPKAWKMLF